MTAESYDHAPAPLETSSAPPHNIEAEQALLGALLFDNEVYHRVGDWLKPDHFYDPLHGRIYEACSTLIERGQRADPTTLKHFFDIVSHQSNPFTDQYFLRDVFTLFGNKM